MYKMGSYKERHVFPRDLERLAAPGYNPIVVVNDDTDFTTTQTTSTFTMTPTRVDTGTAGAATAAIAASATDSVMLTNIQAAIRALGGIYADADVTQGIADHWNIIVKGGYDITWASTATAAAFVQTTPGKVSYIKQLPIGKFAVVKKLVARGFNDASLDISIVDANSKNVFVATVIDTSTASADTPYVKLLAADGVAGEDGAAAANVAGGLFKGPLTVTIATSAPVLARGIVPVLALTILDGEGGGAATRLLERTSGARTTLTGTIGLGVPIGKIRKIRLFASSDTTVAPTLTDADGLVVYTKTSTDFTTAVLEQLSHEGVDQANNAVADLLDVIARGPLTISGTGLGAGTFTITVWVEA